jgi:hypothetical protein
MAKNTISIDKLRTYCAQELSETSEYAHKVALQRVLDALAGMHAISQENFMQAVDRVQNDRVARVSLRSVFEGALESLNKTHKSL